MYIMQMLLFVWLLLEMVKGGQLEVLYHKDFWISSVYFYNDVLFQFNKEVDYYNNKKMEVLVNDRLVAYSDQYWDGMDITRYMKGGVDYAELWEHNSDSIYKGE